MQTHLYTGNVAENNNTTALSEIKVILILKRKLCTYKWDNSQNRIQDGDYHIFVTSEK